MNDNELMLDVGQANEFKLACRRAGYTNAYIKRLCEGDVLERVLPAVRGFAKVVPDIIDCDVVPFTPQGWSVREEDQLPGRVRGQFVFDPAKIVMYLPVKQQGDRVISGTDLLKEWGNTSVLSAHVLDYLIARPHLIPEELVGKLLFFWGTIYHGSLDRLMVRCIGSNLSGWTSTYVSLDSNWPNNYLAAICANR